MPKPTPMQQAILAAAALTAVVFAVVIVLALPGFTVRDSALFSMVAASGGIAHPPGSPTWCVLATAFVWLFAFEDAARGTNLFCGLLGALTCGGLYLLAWRLIPRFAPELGAAHRLVASLFPPLLLMQSPGWWSQCLTTEQYTLMTALLVALAHVGLSATAAGWWVALGVLWGLAIGNHLSQVCLVVHLGLLCLRAPLSPLAVVRRVALVSGGLLAGLAVYTWVPLRSVVDPLVDTGNIDHFRDLPWLVGRVQFTRREWWEAPVGFASEWLRSYALMREMGLGGIVLALVGAAACLRHARMTLLLIAAFVLPYAAGIMYGHLRQAGFGVGYVLHYGVVDWHVAIYLWFALLGGLGAVAAGRSIHARRGDLALRLWFGILGAVLLVGGSVSALSESRFASTGMDVYTAAMLDPLPEDAVAVLSTDNVAFIVAYDWWLNERRRDVTIAWGAPTFAEEMAKKIDQWQADPVAVRRDYFRRVVFDKRMNPLRVALPTDDQVTSAVLCTDFTQAAARSARYLIPRGFLFEVSSEAVPDEVVNREDQRWRDSAKLPVPTTVALYQERRAWSELWERRALYFLARNQIEEARANYATALAWFPEESRLWYRFGECHDRLGDRVAAEQAYRSALEAGWYEVGVRLNLASIVAARGELEEALELLEMENRLDPTNTKVTDAITGIRGVLNR